MKNLVAIDLAMACTAMVTLNENGILVDQYLCTTNKKHTIESRLIEIRETITGYIMDDPEVVACVFEKPALGAKGSYHDQMMAAWWMAWCSVWENEMIGRGEGCLMGTITVQDWREDIIPGNRTKKVKEALAEKYGNESMKKAVVDLLPEDVSKTFYDYIETVEFPGANDEDKKRQRDAREMKRKAIYDLADAYFLARYRLKLEAL